MSAKLEPMKFEFEKFYQAVNAKRTARAASWRQVAREIGIGKSTLARMAQNKRPDADGLAALSFWAGAQSRRISSNPSRAATARTNGAKTVRR